MTAPVNFYDILHVAPGADHKVLRAAYRALAQRHHPDRRTGSEASMIALNQAWEILRNPARRAAYDRELAALATQARTGEPETDVAAYPAPRTPGPLARRAMADERVSAVLDFGRFAGWSLADVARRDPDYLEWLARTPAGRALAAEIDRLLRQRRKAAPIRARAR